MVALNNSSAVVFSIQARTNRITKHRIWYYTADNGLPFLLAHLICFTLTPNKCFRMFCSMSVLTMRCRSVPKVNPCTHTIAMHTGCFAVTLDQQWNQTDQFTWRQPKITTQYACWPGKKSICCKCFVRSVQLINMATDNTFSGGFFCMRWSFAYPFTDRLHTMNAAETLLLRRCL